MVVARDLFDNVRHAKIDPMRFIDMAPNLCAKSNVDLSVIKQILTYSVYISNHCILTTFQRIPKNKLFDLICALIQKYSSLKDYLINLLLDVLDTTQIIHIEYIISFIKENNPLAEEKDFLIDEETENSANFSKKISFELGYNTDFLKFETKMRILETVYESDYHCVDLERKKRIRRGLSFFDSRFECEPFIDDTLEACLPDVKVNKPFNKDKRKILELNQI